MLRLSARRTPVRNVRNAADPIYDLVFAESYRSAAMSYISTITLNRRLLCVVGSSTGCYAPVRHFSKRYRPGSNTASPDKKASKNRSATPESIGSLNVGTFEKRKLDTQIINNKNVFRLKAAGTIYCLNRELSSVVSESGVPKDLFQGIFSLLSEPSLILRDSIAELIESVNSAGQTTVISGREGSGKSAALLFLASYLLNEGHIVLYIPDIKQYIDGRYPYGRSDFSGDSYDQDVVSADILKKFVSVNGCNLLKISQDNRNLHDICTRGISNLNEATKCLRQVFSMIVECDGSNKDLRIYLLLDQMDRLFSLSKYYDGMYRIPVPALTYAQILIPLVTGVVKLKAGAVISAIEHPTLLEYDPPIFTALNFCKRLGKYDDRLKQQHDILTCKKRYDEYRSTNDLYPMNISFRQKHDILEHPNIYVPEASLFENMNLELFHMPLFSAEEINFLMSFYRSAMLIPSNYPYTQNFTLKHLLVTNGNGKELFKFLTQM